MQENVRKSHFPRVILLLLLVLAGGYFLLKAINSGLLSQKSNLEKAIQYIQSEYVFGRIDPLSAGNYLLTFYNIEGKKIGSKEVSVPGSDLYIESRVAVVTFTNQERAFVFPTRAFSDSLPEQNGIDIRPIYLKNGYPAIYSISSNDVEFSKVVMDIYRLSGMENADSDPSTAAVRINDAVLHRIPGSAANRPLEMLVHPNGGLELREAK